MEIAFFQAKCSECGTEFSTPLLSDFSYGQFIARSENGLFFAYLNAIEELAFKEISCIFDKLLKECGSSLDENTCFHSVVGKCSDMIEGQEMRIDIGPICPYCKSSSYHYDNLKMVEKREIENLSFTSFVALSDEEKNSLIRDYICGEKKSN